MSNLFRSLIEKQEASFVEVKEFTFYSECCLSTSLTPGWSEKDYSSSLAGFLFVIDFVQKENFIIATYAAHIRHGFVLLFFSA